MKAENILIRNLSNYGQCLIAIDEIESDYRNSIGGLESWNSGRETFLKESAKRKIEAINRKADSLYTDELLEINAQQ